MLAGEKSSGSSKAGEDLVEDEQHIVRVAPRAQGAKHAWWPKAIPAAPWTRGSMITAASRSGIQRRDRIDVAARSTGNGWPRTGLVKVSTHPGWPRRWCRRDKHFRRRRTDTFPVGRAIANTESPFLQPLPQPSSRCRNKTCGSKFAAEKIRPGFSASSMAGALVEPRMRRVPLCRVAT